MRNSSWQTLLKLHYIVTGYSLYPISLINNFIVDKISYSAISCKLFQTKSSSVAMKEMDQSVLETCKLLENVTDEQIDSLAAFRASKPLVDWLKTSMKGLFKTCI